RKECRLSPGAFSEWQAEYAARGIPTFPVSAEKTPMTKGYLKTGLRGSRALAEKFANADAFGFAAGRRTGITVVDIDSLSPALLAHALEEWGQTPFVVRTSGGHHLYYSNKGERRHI